MKASDVFRGALIVAGRDLRSNSRGLKVWIISGLTLLAVLGAAFGIGSLVSQAPPLSAQYHVWADVVWPTASNATAGIEVWVSDYVGTPHAGFPVVLGNAYANLENQTFVERQTLTTNASGWVVFPDLGPGFWPLQVTVGAVTAPPQVLLIPGSRPTYNLTVDFHSFEVLGDGAQRDLGLQARWI